MADNIETKVVLKQRILHGSDQPDFLQRVATVYINGREYRVSAPPEAKGDALEWARHFSVRQLVDVNSETEVIGFDRARALKATIEQLEREKRDANRPVGVHPDGLHCDAQICLSGHVQHCDSTPFDSKAHCTRCGAPCIDECPTCKDPIQGVRLYSSPASYIRPQYCHRCGTAYPWMEDLLRTARQLVEHDDMLSPEDREKLWDDLQYVMTDPKANLAPAKKKLIDIKLGKATAFVREAILDLIAKTTAEMFKG